MMDTTFRIVPCGDDALRIVSGPGRVRHHLAQYLAGLTDWLEIVPGKDDVTVVFDVHVLSMAAARRRLQAQVSDLPELTGTGGQLHLLNAVFGGTSGPDLDAVAGANGLSVEDVIEGVCGAELEVDMIGFTPGFAYLSGVPQSLKSQRLATPRMRVPSGSIGIITGQAGLYALEGPGGWPLIGRVTEALFDPHAVKPFRILPGDRVRLVAERGP